MDSRFLQSIEQSRWTINNLLIVNHSITTYCIARFVSTHIHSNQTTLHKSQVLTQTKRFVSFQEARCDGNFGIPLKMRMRAKLWNLRIFRDKLRTQCVLRDIEQCPDFSCRDHHPSDAKHPVLNRSS